MRLFLVRHASYEAGAFGNPGLSDYGRQQARLAGQGLLDWGAAPELAVVSRYRRAKETALLLLEKLGRSSVPLVELAEFSPGGDPETMRTVLESFDATSVLVVGHMSSIGHLATSLSPEAPFEFLNCTSVALTRSPDGVWQVDAVKRSWTP